MKRIWIFVLVAVLWCSTATIASLVTSNPIYLAWAIFLPPSLALLNMARPRRGIQYVYWNRYIYAFGSLIFGLVAGPLLVAYLSQWIKILETIFATFLLLWLIGFPIAWVLWFKFLFMPSWGPWRLRKLYPKMVTAARRLKKFGESYTWYFPLIHAQGKPYLVVGYNIQHISGIATLDEQGCFVKEEMLAIRLLRCYKLAMAVLHMPDSYTRAKDIDSYRKTDRQMQQAYQRFRENEKNFLAAGQPAYDLWKSICEFEPDFHAITRHWVERKTWQAKWALEHGLNKLTEISDKQLSEVEGTLEQLNVTLLSHTTRLDQVGADAEALLKTYVQGKSIRLQHHDSVEEMLKALVLLRQGTVAWTKDVREFYPLKNEWLAWQSRKIFAERLNGRESYESVQQPRARLAFAVTHFILN